jgi:hypothetical protein
MPQSATRSELATSVLIRYLPTLTRIITTASFCHLYRGAFGASQEFAWEKKDLGGTLFLCASSTSSDDSSEQYHLIILNRLGTANFIWTLSSPDGIEENDLHLVLHATSGFCPGTPEPGYEIDETSCYGLWVYRSDNDHDRMRDAIMECTRLAAGQKSKSTIVQPSNGTVPVLSGYSIMNQVFPQQQQNHQQQYSLSQPTQRETTAVQPVPQNGDVLRMLFQNARQRGSTPQPTANSTGRY